MTNSFAEMNLAELQVLYITDTKVFIDALDRGTSMDLLQPMRDRIKLIGTIIETKLIESKGELKTASNQDTSNLSMPTFSSPSIAS